MTDRNEPLEILDVIERNYGVRIPRSEWHHFRAALEAQRDEPAQAKSASHLIALMDGLEIPRPEYWVQRPPSDLKLVGETITRQAKQAKEKDDELAQKNARIADLQWALMVTEKQRDAARQSAAAIKAEALRECAEKMAKDNDFYTSAASEFVEWEADRIEREAKEEA